MTSQSGEWITAAAAAKILGIGNQDVRFVLARGKVRRKQLPGMLVKYDKADVEALLASSITNVGVPPRRPKGNKKRRLTGDIDEPPPASPSRRRTA